MIVIVMEGVEAGLGTETETERKTVFVMKIVAGAGEANHRQWQVQPSISRFPDQQLLYPLKKQSHTTHIIRITHLILFLVFSYQNKALLRNSLII